MTQINSNINIQNFAGQQQKQQQTVRIPNYYYVPDTYSPQSVKEVVKENPFYDMFLKPFVEHPVAVLATWLGLGVGLDAYSTACSGKYEDSLVKKAANFGDNIQNSKIIQNKPVQAVISGLGSVGNAGKKAVQNSAILRAMKDTPTMPEWSTVKTQMFNQKQEVVQDFIRITEALKLDSAEAPSLKNIGLNDREITMLKKTFNVQKISQIPETEAVNQVLLDRLGKTPEEIKKIQGMGAASTKAVKTEILKEMGLDAEKLKLIKDDVYGKYINDVKTAAGKVKGKVKMGKSLAISPEINLLGKTVDEAIAELDKYLDDASLAHLSSVRIVHGKGTGALRAGIHKYLKRQKHVKSFRLGAFGEGDAGVTIAELK